MTRMVNTSIRCLVCLVVAAISPPLAAVESPVNTISVEGYAWLWVQADAAKVDMWAVISTDSLAILPQIAEQALAEFSKDIYAKGLRRPLRRDGSLNIVPETWSEETRYKIKLRLVMFIDDLNVLGDLIGIFPASASTGTDTLHAWPWEVEYILKEPAVYRGELIRKALDDARDKAEGSARENGRTLGGLSYLNLREFEVSSPSYDYNRLLFLEAEDRARGNPAQKVLIECKVSAVYELSD